MLEHIVDALGILSLGIVGVITLLVCIAVLLMPIVGKRD